MMYYTHMYQGPNKILAEIGRYLSQPLPKEKDQLIEHITGLDSLRYSLAQSTSDWFKMLTDARQKMIRPKELDLKATELDRTTRLNADVSIIERDYKLLVRLEELVDQRVSLGRFLVERL